MSIEKSDYFEWYNEEITRYRDHEWRLTSFSIALSSAIVLFAKNSDTNSLIPPWSAALLIIVLIFLLIIAEIHTHARLNEYRERRELLLQGKDHRYNIKRLPFLKGIFTKGTFDIFYFCSFLVVSALFGVGAALVLI